MSTLDDIYNPPPAPVPYVPPQQEPLRWSLGDLGWLLALSTPLLGLAAWAWSIEPSLWLWVVLGGSFVILESWFSALTLLHRHPEAGRGRRWMIFLAALLPWLIGLGFAAAMMVLLFTASDWAG